MSSRQGFLMQLQLENGADKQHQAHSAPSDVDMNTREQSAAIKKTVVENATRELVLEHACELVETFPISKEKALMLSVIRSWISLPLVLSVSTCDRSITHVMGERFMAIETNLACLLEQWK